MNKSNRSSSRSRNTRSTSSIDILNTQLQSIQMTVADLTLQISSSKTSEIDQKKRISYLENIILTLTGINVNQPV